MYLLALLLLLRMGMSKSQLYTDRMAFIGKRLEQNKIGYDQQTGWIEEKKVSLAGIILQLVMRCSD